MRPRSLLCSKPLASRCRKTRYPLFKALFQRGEKCLAETGRHVSKGRVKCLLRSRVDVREDTRDLLTGKPGSQTRLDEVKVLDFGDLVLAAFPNVVCAFSNCADLHQTEGPSVGQVTPSKRPPSAVPPCNRADVSQIL